jgi:hypothetical protein
MCNSWNNLYDDDYRSEAYYKPECKQCAEKETALQEAREYLEGVIEQLYSKDKLDISTLEFNLDELCSFLGVKIGKDLPNIQRPAQHRPIWMSELMNLTATTN